MSTQPLPRTTSGPGFAVITSEMFVRRQLRQPIMEQARQISLHYDGRIVVPMPEMDEDERPAIANLIAQNIDQHAMRVASTAPSVTVSPTDAGKQRALGLARMQRRALFSWDDDDQRELFDKRRARWLTAWAEAPVVIRPDPKTRRPVWELRNPLGCYPSPLRRYDDMRPPDIINTFERTYQWLKSNYPQLDTLLTVGRKDPYRRPGGFFLRDRGPIGLHNDELIPAPHVSVARRLEQAEVGGEASLGVYRESRFLVFVVGLRWGCRREPPAEAFELLLRFRCGTRAVHASDGTVADGHPRGDVLE